MSGQLEILTGDEADRLHALEEIVTRGARTYIEVGNALLAIRDERLYRQTHASFRDYLRERWDMSRGHGYRLIDAAKTAATLTEDVSNEDAPDDWKQLLRDEYTAAEVSPNGRQSVDQDTRAREIISRELPEPSNERVARKLTATAREDPARARSIWKEAVGRHGPDATAAQVAAIAIAREPDVLDPWQAETKAFLADVRRVLKHQEPRDARRALARWRNGVYRELDRIAKADQ